MEPIVHKPTPLRSPDDFAGLDAWHERSVQFARDLFAAKRNHEPIERWLMRCPSFGYINDVELPWKDDDEKNRAAYAIRRMLPILEADLYSFISEAWAACSWLPGFVEGLPPSEQPESARDDILFISSHAKDGGHRYTRFAVKMHRLPHKCRLLERDDIIDQTFEGRMFNLFRPDPREAEARVKASVAASMPTIESGVFVVGPNTLPIWQGNDKARGKAK